jgi:sulfoxide reductase heme-binding subunit YedZ
MLAWLSVVVMWLLSTTWVRSRFQAYRRAGGNRPATDVTVGVDAIRCGRFGFCEQEAPRVFTLRSDGRLSYASSVPADQLDAVVRAVNVCPARAISVSHLPTILITSATPPAGLSRADRRSRAGGRGRRSSAAVRGGLHRSGGSSTPGDP